MKSQLPYISHIKYFNRSTIYNKHMDTLQRAHLYLAFVFFSLARSLQFALKFGMFEYDEYKTKVHHSSNCNELVGPIQLDSIWHSLILTVTLVVCLYHTFCSHRVGVKITPFCHRLGRFTAKFLFYCKCGGYRFSSDANRFPFAIRLLSNSCLLSLIFGC